MNLGIEKIISINPNDLKILISKYLFVTNFSDNAPTTPSI